MAGEKKGKTYEALVHVALEELVVSKKLAGPLHWNVTPKGMSIEPDFMTGKDPDDPKTILLLNHSNAAGNSHMKFWRNLGELVEAKSVLPTTPRVYCLTFGIIKTDLEPIQENAFDQFIWVRRATQPWADDLDAFISACVPTFPKGKDRQTDFMRDEVKNASVKAKSAYQNLKALLETMHKAKSVALDKMWKDHRARAIPSVPGARRTFVRRGLSKILIFDDLAAAVDGFSGSGASFGACPEYAKLLNLVTEVTHGKSTVVKPADPEIINAIKTLGRTDALSVLTQFDITKVDHWLQSIRNTDHYVAMAEFAAANLASIKNPTKLEAMLRKLYADPDSLTGSMPMVPQNGWPPNSVWLLEYGIELAKMAGGNSTSYGYAQLAKDVANPNGAAGGVPPNVREFLLSPWGHLSEWIHRVPGKDLPKGVLSAVCKVLVSKITGITSSAILSGSKDFAKATANSVIETKLCCYRGFDPLASIIKTHLPSVTQQRIQGCYAERAGRASQAGKTTVFKISGTIINWQSCSDAGRDHKKKELCGRAIALRYHWDGEEFVRRPDVKKMILVIDGTWRQSDLNALMRAGWDEIFYPDEMDQLARAIV